MTDHEIQDRLQKIRPPDWDKDVFVDWYGVDLWGEAKGLSRYLDTWSLHRMHLKDVRTETHVNRIAFERYLKSNNLMPLAFAADRLAIPRETLPGLLNKMASECYLMADSSWNQGVCATTLPENLPDLLPSFPKRVYTNVTSRIHAFHKAARKDVDDNLMMVETETLEGGERKPGYNRDILTLEPVALGDSVWLELGKPVSLPPDVCSKRTYLEFREQLDDVRMGPEPEWAREHLASCVAEPPGDYA